MVLQTTGDRCKNTLVNTQMTSSGEKEAMSNIDIIFFPKGLWRLTATGIVLSRAQRLTG